ncbi:hypothetical protein A4R43_21600 [Amycolatopsis albispora]|uniref:Uncharacterized protein n=1 Tax=Amycolatopsis albispora TaxID=1804986 RepID=A0A344L9P9_9PSEU|nr:hypothetical protein A4R43_21600 [Amycolatopsis albispora]
MVISAWRDEPLEPPVRLAVDEGTLAQHLSLLYSDAAALWPNTEQEAGAFNLLTVHIEETVLTRKPGQADLILDRVKRVPEWVEPGDGA